MRSSGPWCACRGDSASTGRPRVERNPGRKRRVLLSWVCGGSHVAGRDAGLSASGLHSLASAGDTLCPCQAGRCARVCRRL
jgi:hypothetical protein